MTDTFFNPAPSVLDTDLKLYRYWNVRGIVDASSNSQVAAMLGKQTSYITAISGPNPNRAIGDDLSYQIEKVFKLPAGAMDARPDRRTTNNDPQIAEVARMMSMANHLDKTLIAGIVRTICGHSISVVKAMQSPSGERIISSSQISASNPDIAS